MRRFSLLLAGSILVAFLGGAQELRNTQSEPFRRPALDVALGDGVIWLADGYGVTVASRSTSPVPLASKALRGTTSRLTIEGDRTWVVSGTDLLGLSWNGEEIMVEETIEIGEEAFDITGARGFLYLATPSGVVQIDTAIRGSRRVLSTTTGGAVSLATDGATLIAADGDATAEIYTIDFPALPQKIGVAELGITGGNRVHEVDGNLLVSNGRDSQLFGGLRPPFTSLALLPVGASAAGSISPGIIFTSGQDTTVRLIDLRLSAGRPSIVYEERIAPSSGSINRISRIQSDGNVVYVAAGDLGLQIYDIVDFGIPFPIVRSFVSRADGVVDLGTGQVVASSANAAPRLYTIETSGALREVRRWDDQHGATALDHAAEVALLVQGAKVRLVRPSGTVTGEFSFGAAVRSGVVVDGEIWVTLADRSLWRARVDGGEPEKITIANANPSFLARGEGRLVLVSLNDDGTTTLHEINRTTPAESVSMEIEGAATSGAGVGTDAVVVATFRGLSLLDLKTGEERVVALGSGALPRALKIVGNEILVLSSERIERRKLLDGSLIVEMPLLSAGLALSAENGSSRVIVGAADAIYTVNLTTGASQPVRLGRFRESRFYDHVMAWDHSVHLAEGNVVWSRILQNQGLESNERATPVPGDVVGFTANLGGFCALDSRGEVSCFDHAGAPRGSGEIAALDDATFLSIHSARDALLVSLLEGCLGSGCRKRTVAAILSSGALVPGSEIEGEIIALSESSGQIAVLTDLPRELHVYEIADRSALLQLAGRRSLEEESHGLALDAARGVVYLAGESVVAYSLPGLDRVGAPLGPIENGFATRDQRLAVFGDHVLVIGRSSAPEVYGIEGPTRWVPEQTIVLPGSARGVARAGSSFVVLTDFSLEILSADPPIVRRRGTVRR